MNGQLRETRYQIQSITVVYAVVSDDWLWALEASAESSSTSNRLDTVYIRPSVPAARRLRWADWTSCVLSSTERLLRPLQFSYKVTEIHTVIQIFHQNFSSLLNGVKVSAFTWYSVKNWRYFRCPVWKTKNWLKMLTYMKTETYKLYSRHFWIFLPNFIKIGPYKFELCRFKVGAFFETQCIRSINSKRKTCKHLSTWSATNISWKETEINCFFTFLLQK